MKDRPAQKSDFSHHHGSLRHACRDDLPQTSYSERQKPATRQCEGARASTPSCNHPKVQASVTRFCLAASLASGIGSACLLSILLYGHTRSDCILQGLIAYVLGSGWLIVLWRRLTGELWHSRSLLIEIEQRMLRVAHFDPLTGLANRVLLHERITRALASADRHDEPVSLLFIDLDRFKEANDRFGHHVGDQLLTAAAERMSALVREVDTVARLGGDEFVLLLPNTGVEGAARVAEKLRANLDEPYFIAGRCVQVSASIGLSCFPDLSNAEPDALLLAADTAMYSAKHRGGNQFQFAEAGPLSLPLRANHSGGTEEDRSGMDRLPAEQLQRNSMAGWPLPAVAPAEA